MADRIGPAACPVCESATAIASLMATQRVCITCNTCKSQTFARGDLSDERLRQRIEGHAARRDKPDAPAPTTTATAPAAKPAPAPVTTAPAPAPKARSWGLLG